MKCKKCGAEVTKTENDTWFVAEFHCPTFVIRAELCGQCANEALMKRLVEKCRKEESEE